MRLNVLTKLAERLLPSGVLHLHYMALSLLGTQVVVYSGRYNTELPEVPDAKHEVRTVQLVHLRFLPPGTQINCRILFCAYSRVREGQLLGFAVLCTRQCSAIVRATCASSRPAHLTC